MKTLIIGISGAGKSTLINKIDTPKKHLFCEMLDAQEPYKSLVSKNTILFFTERTKKFLEITTQELRTADSLPAYIEAVPMTAQKIIQNNLLYIDKVFILECPSITAAQRCYQRSRKEKGIYIPPAQIERQQKKLDRLITYLNDVGIKPEFL